MKYKIQIVALLFFFALKNEAQVNGGEHIFEYLRLSTSPHMTALGGITVINPSQDIMLASGNPSLLREHFHTQLGLNYNMYYAGTRVSNLLYAHHVKSIHTTLGFGLQYVNYGDFKLTDNVGNQLGTGSANDYCLQVYASKQYLEKWRYGMTMKFANSRLIDTKARALLADIGVSYFDTTNKMYFGFVVKNAGVTVQNYERGYQQPLPLDIQMGVTKKFKKAPFAISILGHHLYTWDVRYNNPADKVNNSLLFSDTTTKEKKYIADKLFRHLVFAVEMNLGKRMEISVGYNHMRRGELALDDKKFITGFSLGAGLYLHRFIIHFAQSYYHLTGAYNEIGINFQLNQLIGFGEGGKKINWAEKYLNSY